ncbi:MAG: DNA methyltransferase, partial [Rhodopila sp.]
MQRPKKTAGVPAGAETGVETLQHPKDVTRSNIPTAETSSLMVEDEAAAKPMLYPRDPRLDPQLVWRGKDSLDAEPLQVDTVPIYIQEKVLPQALIRDLQRQRRKEAPPQADLFGSFDRINDPETKLEFYAHAENWSNRMILGDSLLVMNSLAEKEGLRGQVQMIYLDPPYGIRFGSNWQPSTLKPEAKNGKVEGLTREPEQIKVFKDTWRDGINSYLAYLRDRLVVSRELLSDTGSIFVQIGDENVHLVRVVMDEVFGRDNFCSLITVMKTAGQSAELLAGISDYLLWYGKDRNQVKYRPPLNVKRFEDDQAGVYRWIQLPDLMERRIADSELANIDQIDGKIFCLDNLTSQRPPGD